MELPREPPRWGVAEHAAVALPDPPAPLLPAPIPRANWLGEQLERQDSPPPPAPAPLAIEPVDWAREEAERARLERAEAERERTAAIQAELARHAESERAAKPKPWTATQMQPGR